MHYVGFVFVDEPTEAAVEKAMADHGGENGRKWDWYCCGGRWDGYLSGEEEMKSRETDGGFNFAIENKSAIRNSCRVSDLPEEFRTGDKTPYFFVSGYSFIPREYYNEYERSANCKSDHPDFAYGAILPTPHFEERYQRALKDNADKWLVVVDAHN